MCSSHTQKLYSDKYKGAKQHRHACLMVCGLHKAEFTASLISFDCTLMQFSLLALNFLPGPKRPMCNIHRDRMVTRWASYVPTFPQRAKCVDLLEDEEKQKKLWDQERWRRSPVGLTTSENLDWLMDWKREEEMHTCLGIYTPAMCFLTTRCCLTEHIGPLSN